MRYLGPSLRHTVGSDRAVLGDDLDLLPSTPAGVGISSTARAMESRR